MSYGLYDADLSLYPIPFYNLELMKLSSYYKRKREIVGLSPDFSPNRYTHFLVRQDFYNPNSYFTNSPNVTYGGRAFDGEKYKPLPMDIECMKPDILLYNNAPIPKSRRYKSSISTMRRAEHIRLSLDSKTIWKDCEKQLRYDSNIYGIIFHDYNLNDIEGSAEFIQEMLPEWIKFSLGRRIGTKFPIQVSNQYDFCKWLRIMPMGTYYSLQHNGLIKESYIPDLVDLNLNYAISDQVVVKILPEELTINNIQRIFRSIINLRSRRLIFPLIYNENSLISDDWKKVMRLINLYNRHLVLSKGSHFFKYTEPYETLYSYCYHMIKQPKNKKDSIFTKESIQSIFQFVRENNYDLFKDFYEYRGGEIRNDR